MAMGKLRTQSNRNTNSRSRPIITNMGVNPLDILQSMRLHEKDHTFYSQGHAYLKYRKVVAAWLIEIGDYFSLQRSTTYAAIYLLDRIKPDDRFKRFQWQLLAICSLLLSAKYYEREQDVPALSKLEEITQENLPSKLILTYELWILTRIDWDVAATTSLHYLDFYLALGIFCEGDIATDPLMLERGHELPRTYAETLAQMCLLDYDIKPYKDSMIAAAIIYLVREKLGLVVTWPADMASLTGYTCEDLDELVHLLRTLANEPCVATPETELVAVATPNSKVAQARDSSPRGVDDLV